MKRAVMVIWKGFAWSMELIEAENGLRESLPNSIRIKHDSRTGRGIEAFDVVLTGFTSDTPIYTQQ